MFLFQVSKRDDWASSFSRLQHRRYDNRECEIAPGARPLEDSPQKRKNHLVPTSLPLRRSLLSSSAVLNNKFQSYLNPKKILIIMWKRHGNPYFRLVFRKAIILLNLLYSSCASSSLKSHKKPVMYFAVVY